MSRPSVIFHGNIEFHREEVQQQQRMERYVDGKGDSPLLGQEVDWRTPS